MDAYIDSNRALFEINRNMCKDIQAAQILGLGEGKIEDIMIKRGERRAFNSLIDGEFRPYKMSNDVEQIFEINAERLGVANPLDSALDVLDNLYEILSQTPTSLDVFPNLPNPFRQSIIPNLGPVNQGNIPANVQNALGFVGQQNITIPYNQLNQEQKLDRINEIFNNG
mgnify:FL=1